MPATLSSQQAMDRYYLEIRCKLLEVGASLDRIERGQGFDTCQHDPRLEWIAEAIDALKTGNASRAEKIQNIFSLPYDPNWRETMGV